MNQDAQVHLHVIPRYYDVHVSAGFEFCDMQNVIDLRLPRPAHEQVIAVVREALSGART